MNNVLEGTVFVSTVWKKSTKKMDTKVLSKSLRKKCKRKDKSMT